MNGTENLTVEKWIGGFYIMNKNPAIPISEQFDTKEEAEAVLNSWRSADKMRDAMTSTKLLQKINCSFSISEARRHVLEALKG